MIMIKACIFDLDGTLTNSEKKVSERNKRALQEAIKRGVSIILASGRPTYGMSEVWEASFIVGTDIRRCLPSARAYAAGPCTSPTGE